MELIKPHPLKSDYPLFIYLPGMDGTGQLLHKQVKSLARFFDIRCLSIPSEDRSDWDTLSRGVIALIEREQQKKFAGKNKKLSPKSRRFPPVYLCGESFGGCLALKIALDAPWLCEKLVLINAASSFNQRPWLGWGIQLTQWVPEVVHHNSTVGLLPFLAALGKVEIGDRRFLLKAMQSVPQSIVSWRLWLLKEFFVETEHLRRLTQPFLILASAADRLLPSVEEAQRLMRYLPDAQMVVLPNSGHACLLESEIRLAEILKSEDFLPKDLSYPALFLSPVNRNEYSAKL